MNALLRTTLLVCFVVSLLPTRLLARGLSVASLVKADAQSIEEFIATAIVEPPADEITQLPQKMKADELNEMRQRFVYPKMSVAELRDWGAFKPTQLLARLEPQPVSEEEGHAIVAEVVPPIAPVDVVPAPEPASPPVEISPEVAAVSVPVSASESEPTEGVDAGVAVTTNEQVAIATVTTNNVDTSVVTAAGPTLTLEPDLIKLPASADVLSTSARIPQEVSAPKKPHIADSQDSSDEVAADDDMVADSVAEPALPDFFRKRMQVAYASVRIQIIDDRSQVETGRIYPVPEAKVTLIGTEFEATTDARGFVNLEDMPRMSRYLVRVTDPLGRVRPTVREVQMPHESNGVVRLRTRRYHSVDTLQKVARVVQAAEKASFCAFAQNSAASPIGVQGMSVQLDIAGDGPFYFNKYGFLDTTKSATGDEGLFCFFNLEGGPAAVSFFEGDQHVTTVPFALFSGYHSELDFSVYDAQDVRAFVASRKTAHEQLSDDPDATDGLRAVEGVDVLPLGVGDPLEELEGEGLLGLDNSVPVTNGRAFALAQTSEFEPTVYAVNPVDERPDANVLPLFPRGFVEDMSVYAQVSFDYELGVVVVEHGELEGQGNESVSIRLIDERNQPVGDGWYYSDRPVTKSIFFNVPPGVYSVVIETGDGYWLQSETVMVFNETVSFVGTGSPLAHRSAQGLQTAQR